MKESEWADPDRKHLKAKGWARMDRTNQGQVTEYWQSPVTDRWGYRPLFTFKSAIRKQRKWDEERKLDEEHK